MSAQIKAALILALPLLLIGTALGGEGVQVKITNDGTQDIVVTVYDMNAKPRAILMKHRRSAGAMTARACATIPPSMCARTPAAASSLQGRASESAARCECRA